ncbi:MAG: hypothetical protein ABI680_11135 [Chthoniobacteraceae bacterium]
MEVIRAKTPIRVFGIGEKDIHLPAPGLRQPGAPVCEVAGVTPDKVEFVIGATIYGQPLRLVRQKDTGGTVAWTLCRG